MQHLRKQILAGALVMSAATIVGYAQDSPDPSANHVFIRSGQFGAMAQGVMSTGPANIQYIATEMSFDGKLVKGAPYSAQAVTETNQTLVDGNRIHRTVTATVYRDSEGRTRREQTFVGMGPLAPAGDAPQTIFINDPVAGNNYVLETASKVARKMPSPPSGAQLTKAIAEQNASLSISSTTSSGPMTAASMGAPARLMIAPQIAPGSAGTMGGVVSAGAMGATMAAPIGMDAIKLQAEAAKLPQQMRTESLGTQNIEGLQAQGSRTTMTIAAGAIGNEQPIDIVSERWYSAELQTVVMTKNSDPRMGETVYRLTNVSRSEPSSALFQVPSDYTVEDRPAIFQMRVPKPGETK